MASVGKFPTAFYNPKFLMGDTLTTEQLAEEYEKLAKLANEKLAKFEGTEWESSNIYKRNAGKYIPVFEIQSKRQLAYLLSDVHRYLNTKNNSVWALQRNRAATIRTLNEHGYTFVNKRNFQVFCEFMEYWRLLKLTSLYDSERVADLADMTYSAKAKPEEVKANFEYYLQNVDYVNKSNFQIFSEFSEQWRALKLTGLYDGERVAKLANATYAAKANPEKVKANFEYYLKNINEVEKIGTKRGGGKSSKDLEKGMENNDLYAEGSPTRSRKKRGNS